MLSQQLDSQHHIALPCSLQQVAVIVLSHIAQPHGFQIEAQEALFLNESFIYQMQ